MDRGAWQATVHGLARVGHDLATKPPPLRDPEKKSFQPSYCLLNVKHTLLFRIVYKMGRTSSLLAYNLWKKSLCIFFTILKRFLHVVVVTVKNLLFNKQIHCQHRILG